MTHRPGTLILRLHRGSMAAIFPLERLELAREGKNWYIYRQQSRSRVVRARHYRGFDA